MLKSKTNDNHVNDSHKKNVAIIKKTGTRRFMKIVVDLFTKIFPDIKVPITVFDQEKNFLCVANGDLNLRDGELSPHDPKRMFSKRKTLPSSPCQPHGSPTKNDVARATQIKGDNMTYFDRRWILQSTPPLSRKNKETPSKRGFSISKSGRHFDIYINSYGLYWLLNFIHRVRGQNFSLCLRTLKKLAVIREANIDWRELRIQKVNLSAYEKTDGQAWLVFYLNGTPNKEIAIRMWRGGKDGVILLAPSRWAPYKIRNDNCMQYVVLTAEEVDLLLRWEQVRIGTPVSK